jgi:hypothetical protein
MSNQLSTEQFAHGMQKLYAKAWKDDAFRNALLSDPRAAIEKEYGTPLPKGLNIEVHEQTDQTLHFVLPPKPRKASGGELSDEDLDRVAGGITGIPPVTISVQSGQFSNLGTAAPDSSSGNDDPNQFTFTASATMPTVQTPICMLTALTSQIDIPSPSSW